MMEFNPKNGPKIGFHYCDCTLPKNLGDTVNVSIFFAGNIEIEFEAL